MNRFIVAEPSRCIGCRTCEVACVLAHDAAGGVGLLAAATFAPRLRVIKSLNISTPVTCHHCDDAPCANACPSGAIVYRLNTVQVEQERCLGCKTCVVACPFGAMEVVTMPAERRFAGMTMTVGVKAEAQKCDLCIDHAGGPACIAVCPTDALHLMDEDYLQETLRHRREHAAAEPVAQAARL
jgi:electron transport protein HydN